MSESFLDGCEACVALIVEAGDEIAPLYSRKLHIRGWAGSFSKVERAFMRAHPPEWYRGLIARAPALGPKHGSQTEVDTAMDTQA